MIQIHDYVAVLENIKKTPITRGTTGTVVSKLSDADFLVEFSVPLHRDNLLVLRTVEANLEVANH